MDFRVFYNQSIHPELLHLELRRRRLVRLLLFSGAVFAGAFCFALFTDVLVVSLLLLLAIGIWIAELVREVRVFLQEFKPRVIGLVLDFMDNDINHGTFVYDAKAFIPPQKFFASRIFASAHEYEGEDYIRGQIREMPFELSELTVREISPVRNRVDTVFRGVFLVGDFCRPDAMRGQILLVPDELRKFLSRTERAFNLAGGRRVEKNLLPAFEAVFDTYATPNARVKDVLSDDMQRALVAYRQRTGKDIFVSIIGDKIYVAVSQAKDLLEPSLWASNTSFEVVREFYEDLQLLLSVVHDVDVMN